MDNLYNRAVRYTATKNYEQSYGQTYGWTEKRDDGSSADELTGLEWKDILSGTINEEDVGVEMAKVKIHRVLVNEEGKIQNTFESEDLEEEYPVITKHWLQWDLFMSYQGKSIICIRDR